MASREGARSLQRQSAKLLISISSFFLVRLCFPRMEYKMELVIDHGEQTAIDTDGGVINASGALSDIDKPPETPTVQLSVS